MERKGEGVEGEVVVEEADQEEDEEEEEEDVPEGFALTGFATYSTETVVCYDLGVGEGEGNGGVDDEGGRRRELRIACQQELTPLDAVLLCGDDDSDEEDGDDGDDSKGGLMDSTGNRIWESSFLLLAALHSQLRDGRLRTRSTPGKRVRQVVELGCGTGVVSIAACPWLLSAWTRQSRSCDELRILATDGNAALLPLVEQNLKDNNVEGVVRYAELMWGSVPSVVHTVLAGADMVVPGTGAAEDGAVDLVLAADVIYDPAVIRPLCETAALLLAGRDAGDTGHAEVDPVAARTEEGRFLLGYFPRMKQPFVEAITPAAEAAGLALLHIHSARDILGRRGAASHGVAIPPRVRNELLQYDAVVAELALAHSSSSPSSSSSAR